MVIDLLVRTINILSNAIILLVIIDSVLSYFLNPLHPVREILDHLVNPMLAPIRRVVPLVGMIDFSPLILIVLVYVLSTAIINFLYILR